MGGLSRRRMTMPPPLVVAATRRREGTAAFPQRWSWKPSKHPSMDVPASMAIKKSTQKLPRVEYAKKDTRLCNANPLPRGSHRPSCGGGRGGPGGLGSPKASMPPMGRGDDSRTAARVMDGEVAIRNEEAEKVSESLQSLLYQQTGFVEYWTLNTDFLILATISKFTL